MATRGAPTAAVGPGTEALLAKRLARHGPAVSGAALAGVLSQAATAAAPASVMSSTIKAVTLVAAGPTVSGAAVSLKVAALTEGVLKAMYLNKLMKATAVLCAISMLVFAAGQLGYGTASGTPGQATPRTAKKSTRVIVPAALVNDAKVDFSIISINPDTGSWKRLTGIGDYPRVSPDGQTVLFLRDDAVWNCDAAGSDNPGKLFAWSGYGGPVWSADGKHLYYSTMQSALGNNLWQHQSWRCDADGGNPVKLKLPVGEAILDVSPDGKYCVTRSRLVTRLNSSALMIMKLDGTGSQRLSAGGGFNEPARFAPGGKRVAYRRNDDAGFSVWTVAADGKHNRKVFGEAGVFVGNCCWSPDGRRLAVVAADLMPAQRPDGTSINIIPYLRDEGHWRIEIMDADGQNRIRLPLKATVRSLGRADWHGLSD